MTYSLLAIDFSSIIQVFVWCVLPLYGSFLGLAIPFLLKAPSRATFKKGAIGGEGREGYFTQIGFFVGALLTLSCYRGEAGAFCQGQLSLTPEGAKFSMLILYLLGLALATSISVGAATAKTGPVGFSVWSLGPTLSFLWATLPMVTQLTTALLCLELIGVGLVWALTSLGASSPNQRASNAGPSLVYALVIFVWASGISALSLLIGMGLTTLEGASVNSLGCTAITTPGRAFVGVGEVLFLLVLVFKFLMGGGQFLLLAWYRLLPQQGLVFYLFFYYPAHLIISSTFFLGFFLSPLAAPLSLFVSILVVAVLALLPQLGAQSSPALTLGGSSFVGLSFLGLAMLNLTF